MVSGAVCCLESEGPRIDQVCGRTRSAGVSRGDVCPGHSGAGRSRLSVAARRLPLCPLCRGDLQLWTRHLLPGDRRQTARQHQLMRQLRHLLSTQPQVPSSSDRGRHLSAVKDWSLRPRPSFVVSSRQMNASESRH